MGKAVDLTGQVFGQLTALRPITTDKVRKWECKCECGNIVTVRTGALRSGNNISCGCKKASVHIKCDTCGKAVKRKKSRVGKFCSHECYWFAKQGSPPPNKGKRLDRPSKRLGRRQGPMSEKNKRAISKGWQKRLQWNTYRSRRYPRGPEHWNWKNGATTNNYRERKRFGHNIHKRVLKRDNYTCKQCGQYNGYLHVDHIKSWTEHPELRFDINNCQTLCMSCHYEKTFNKPMPPGTIWGKWPKENGRVIQ